MWLMFAHFDAAGLDPAILIVDHAGEPRHVASSVEDALDWLGSIGQPEVGIPVEGGTEIYRITPLGASRLRRPGLSLPRTPPPGSGGDSQSIGGAPVAPYLAPAGNRCARRKARASLRHRNKHWRRAGP